MLVIDSTYPPIKYDFILLHVLTFGPKYPKHLLVHRAYSRLTETRLTANHNA